MNFDPASALVHQREIAAPPELIFAAFRDPHQLARWWGPEGFTNTFERFEFREGGAWHLVMHGPDGTHYPNELVFASIEPPHRIVIDHLRPMHRFILTVTLTVISPKTTQVTWQMIFESPDEARRLREVLAVANEQVLDRLSSVVSHSAP